MTEEEKTDSEITSEGPLEVTEGPLAMRPAEQRDSITVVEQIYHQPAGEEPTAYHHSFVRKLFIQEQPYSRKIKVGEGWQPLDLGWFRDRPDAIGMVQVVNSEGRLTQTQPTDEERAAVAAKVICVVSKVVGDRIIGVLAEDDFCWQIFPGESFLGSPTNANRLWIRCKSGVAQATVNVFPR
jgi:hypothetical protein